MSFDIAFFYAVKQKMGKGQQFFFFGQRKDRADIYDLVMKLLFFFGRKITASVIAGTHEPSGVYIEVLSQNLNGWDFGRH